MIDFQSGKNESQEKLFDAGAKIASMSMEGDLEKQEQHRNCDSPLSWSCFDFILFFLLRKNIT